MKDQYFSDFDEMMTMKEKRRNSRFKEREIHERSRFKSSKSKHRESKKFNYDPDLDEEYYYKE